MPSLLIEVDFISNKEVENNLINEKYLKDIADTISSTLLSFVNKSIVDDKVFSNGSICSTSKDTIIGDMNEVNFYRVCIGSFNNKDNSSKDKSVAPEANACPPPRYLFAISLTGICLDLIETRQL